MKKDLAKGKSRNWDKEKLAKLDISGIQNKKKKEKPVRNRKSTNVID